MFDWKSSRIGCHYEEQFFPKYTWTLLFKSFISTLWKISHRRFYKGATESFKFTFPISLKIQQEWGLKVRLGIPWGRISKFKIDQQWSNLKVNDTKVSATCGTVSRGLTGVHWSPRGEDWKNEKENCLKKQRPKTSQITWKTNLEDINSTYLKQDEYKGNHTCAYHSNC